jgi:hypothetical protein
MRLVRASATSPELQARLRDTLNMARDTDKWKKLTAMLSEKVGLCPAQHSTAQCTATRYTAQHAMALHTAGSSKTRGHPGHLPYRTPHWL